MPSWERMWLRGFYVPRVYFPKVRFFATLIYSIFSEPWASCVHSLPSMTNRTISPRLL